MKKTISSPNFQIIRGGPDVVNWIKSLVSWLFFLPLMPFIHLHPRKSHGCGGWSNKGNVAFSIVSKLFSFHIDRKENFLSLIRKEQMAGSETIHTYLCINNSRYMTFLQWVTINKMFMENKACVSYPYSFVEIHWAFFLSPKCLFLAPKSFAFHTNKDFAHISK